MEKCIKQRVPLVDEKLLPADLHPVLRQVYLRRPIQGVDGLDHNLERLLPFSAMKGIDAAVDLLVEALEQHWHILIVGDFDADGATSCALAVRALRLLGVHSVDYLVPNRFDYGYGLSPEIVEVAAVGKPDLIVTVDNGIASQDGVLAAQAHGIRVLVTDHHLPGDTLPQAEAIVNPNQQGCTFPSKNLAGVGVIFYLMLALRTRLREQNYFEKTGLQEPNMAQLLDLVALGTVADVVPLDHNNRILVAQGLKRIRRRQCSPGILALLQVAGRQVEHLSASDLGYSVAPRLNAAGRLDDMSLGIECLISDDAGETRRLAQSLDQLNRDRREIEGEMKLQAEASLRDLTLEGETLPFGLCLYEQEWHQGVVGIVASRIKERYHRPVIAFADSDETYIKGSARSVPGFHLRDALDVIASKHPGLLKKFGGHAMAAGMTLERCHYDDFARYFDEEVRQHLSEEQLQGVVESDGELRAEYLNLEVADLLRDAGPWGQGFHEPVFDGQFVVAGSRVVGEHHLKCELRADGGRGTVDAIWFHADLEWIPQRGEKIRLAYRLDCNEYRGIRSAQLIVEHLHAIS